MQHRSPDANGVDAVGHGPLIDPGELEHVGLELDEVALTHISILISLPSS